MENRQPGRQLNLEGRNPAVVIPCYGYAHLLGEAIDSALAQTVPPSEILVVDDGSPDDPAAVADSYEDARIKVLRRPNGGPGAARNTGAAACSSPYLVFLDADDRLVPEYLERTLPVLESSAADVGYVYTQCRYFGSESGVSQFPEWNLRRLLRWPFVHASALLRTEVVLEHPYDERRRPGVEDWDFYLTLAEHGIRGVLLDEPLLLYRKHGGSSRGDRLETDPLAERAFHEILRKHWRLGGVRHAARVEAYYLRSFILRSARASVSPGRRRTTAARGGPSRTVPPSSP